jgi:anaerobic magnesium-protoporphyrin IX monomethyl ester cyclase
MVHDADIEIIGNYLFGLPGDTYETMHTTMELSKELCTLAWNAYAAMALPGSLLYKMALQQGHKMPDTYEGYSFHSYNTQPLPTEALNPAQILEFRDNAWLEYHTHPPFLDKVEVKYGLDARKNIEDMTKIKLRRKILGD